VEIHTRHTPMCGVARISLAPGEAVQANRDAMLASSFGISESRPSRGGSRAQAGPSVFAAPAEGGWIDLAPRRSGDVYPLEFVGRGGWCVARDAILARPATVRIDREWPALKALFGGDTGFLEHYSGMGVLVLACGGPVDAFTLAPGEVITVTPGFLLAYPDALQCRLRAVDPSGPQSVRTGEGLALDFAGPGTVLVQSRDPRLLMS